MEYASILGRPLAHDELQNNYVAMDCMQYNLMYHPRLPTGLCLQQMEAGVVRVDQQGDDDEIEGEEDYDFIVVCSSLRTFLVQNLDDEWRMRCALF